SWSSRATRPPRADGGVRPGRRHPPGGPCYGDVAGPPGARPVGQGSVDPAMELAYIPSPSSGVLYLGPVPLRGYAFCIIIGVFVAVWLGNKRWVARGGDRKSTRLNSS